MVAIEAATNFKEAFNALIIIKVFVIVIVSKEFHALSTYFPPITTIIVVVQFFIVIGDAA